MGQDSSTKQQLLCSRQELPHAVSFFRFWCWTKHQCECERVKNLNWHLFYVTDIPQSMCTMMSTNLIKWCQRDHLLEGILKGLRVWAAGLKLFIFIVSIDDLVCQLCIECSLSLSNNGTKLCVITDMFVTSYSFRLLTIHLWTTPGEVFPKSPWYLWCGTPWQLLCVQFHNLGFNSHQFITGVLKNLSFRFQISKEWPHA